MMLQLYKRTRGDRYSVAIVVSLAIGVAGTSGVFSALSRLLQPNDGLFGRERSVGLMAENRRLAVRTFPAKESFQDWKDVLRSYDVMTGFVTTDSVVRAGDGARGLRTAFVGEDFFEANGLSPKVGRQFDEKEYVAANEVAVIGHGLARSLFGDARGALGQNVFLDGTPIAVVGVLPVNAEFSMIPGERIDVLRPIDLTQHDKLEVIARLRGDVTVLQAQAELDTWANTKNHDATPADDLRWVVVPSSELVAPRVRGMIRVSIIGGMFLLIVTISNVAHLVAAQTKSQRRELATRWALGAGPWWLIRWKLKHAMIMTLLSGSAATVLIGWSLETVGVTLPEDLEFLVGLKIEGGAVLLAMSVGFLSILCFGALPGLLRSPHQSANDLRADNRFGRHSPWGKVLGHLHIITMVVSSVVLAVGTYLVLGTIFNLGRIDPGFEVGNLHSLDVRLPSWKFKEAAHRAAFFETLTDRLASIPGVESVAVSSSAPPQSGIFIGDLDFGDRAREAPPTSAIGRASVGAKYFSTLKQRIVAGREFMEEEIRVGASVVVISEAVAKLIGPNPEAALGQYIRFNDDQREVVGVVADVNTPGILQSLGGVQVYWPVRTYGNSMTVLARGDDDLGSIFRNVVNDIDPDVMVEPAATKRLVVDAVAGIRFLTIFFSLLASLSMGLAVVGVYAVLSNFTIQHSGQIALRMAIGADPKSVRRWVVWQAWSRCLVGVAIGLAISYPFSRLLGGQLFGVGPGNASARIAAALAVLAATLLAAWLPATRASRIEPIEVLKVV